MCVCVASVVCVAVVAAVLFSVLLVGWLVVYSVLRVCACEIVCVC